MPTLSQYWFEDRFFRGEFDGYNVSYGTWAWVSNGAESAATLARGRPDDEQVIDLAAQLNTADIRGRVDRLLGNDADRTSRIRAAGVFWPDVPYHDQVPDRHNAWDMLIRIWFTFHINTPWFCTAADGDLSFYIVVYLDGDGHLQGYVDGASYNYGGGFPFCTGAINDKLDAALPTGMTAVRRVLDERLKPLQAFAFSALYLLPGSGTRADGGFTENADRDVAIAVIP